MKSKVQNQSERFTAEAQRCFCTGNEKRVPRKNTEHWRGERGWKMAKEGTVRGYARLTGAMNIEHRTLNIEHRTSNIEHRTLNIEH
jgi:hypothetical protein